MANTFLGTTWRLDTVAAVIARPQKIKSIKWISPGAVGGDIVRIVDPSNGATLWEEVAAGANFSSSELLETWWNHGFNLQTLGSGYVYLEVS
jgi:hypothetical protein